MATLSYLSTKIEKPLVSPKNHGTKRALDCFSVLLGVYVQTIEMRGINASKQLTQSCWLYKINKYRSNTAKGRATVSICGLREGVT